MGTAIVIFVGCALRAIKRVHDQRFANQIEWPERRRVGKSCPALTLCMAGSCMHFAATTFHSLVLDHKKVRPYFEQKSIKSGKDEGTRGHTGK